MKTDAAGFNKAAIDDPPTERACAGRGGIEAEALKVGAHEAVPAFVVDLGGVLRYKRIVLLIFAPGPRWRVAGAFFLKGIH